MLGKTPRLSLPDPPLIVVVFDRRADVV